MRLNPKVTQKLFVCCEFKPGDKRNAWLWNAHRTYHGDAVFFAPGNMLLGSVRDVTRDEMELMAKKMKRENCYLQPVDVFIHNNKHVSCAAFALQLKN